MANKLYSLYANGDVYHPTVSDHLVMETGAGYIACVVKNRADVIQAIEWFNYEPGEAEVPADLMKEITEDSKILDHAFSSTKLFINNDTYVLVPAGLFQHQLLNEYLAVALGDVFSASSGFDEIGEKPEIVNAYRYKRELVEHLTARLAVNEQQHSISRLLTKAMAVKNMPDSFMRLVFQEKFFNVAIFIKGKLQISHTYSFQSPEDIVYYLLNLVSNFNIDTAKVQVDISGLIDVPSSIFAQVTKFFKNVKVESVHLGKVNVQSDEYPLHYFTSIINLAI